MDKIVEDALKLFKKSVEADKHNKETALDDIKFAVLGEQWDEKDIQARQEDGRPYLTFNKLSPHIRQIVNDARQNKPSIRVRPVDDDADPETAEVLSGLIRNIEQSSNADIAYDTAISQSASGGFGYVRVNIEFAHDDTFDKDICIDRILNQFSVYPDHNATSADGSDWNYCFVTDRLPESEFDNKYPKADKTGWDDDSSDGSLESLNDDGVWIAEYWKREEVSKIICQISDGTIVDEEVYDEYAEIYQAQGLEKTGTRTVKSHKVTQYILSGTEVLETNKWAGKYIPIIPAYGEEIAIEGKRYFRSAVHNSIDAQKTYNFWRTASTESVSDSSKTPWVGEEGSFVDEHKWANSNRVKYAYLEHAKGKPKPERQPFAGVPAGALQESLNSADDIKGTMGMYDASLGAQSNETSGRAILARQREGDVSTFHFIDNMSRLIRHTGRIIIDLIPSVYSSDRIIRVLGEDGKKPQNVKIGQQPEQPEQQGEDMQEQEGLNLSRVYDLSVGKYDIAVDTGPSYTTKREEAATQMTEMARAYPPLMQIAGDLMVKNFDWPGADELAKRLKASLPPQLQEGNPEVMQLQQQMQQMQQQAMQAVQQLKGELDQTKQDKTLEAEKIKIQAYDSETKRLQAVSTGMSPEQIQMMIMKTIQNLIQTPDVTPGSDQQMIMDSGVQNQFQAPQPEMMQPMGQPQPEGFNQ